MKNERTRIFNRTFVGMLAVIWALGCGGVVEDSQMDSNHQSTTLADEGLPPELSELPEVGELPEPGEVPEPEISQCDQTLIECLAKVTPEDIEGFEACHSAFEECAGIEWTEPPTCDEQLAQCNEGCTGDMPECEEICASFYDQCVNGPEVSECDQALMDCLAAVTPEDIEGFDACHQAFEECAGIEWTEPLTCDEQLAQCNEGCTADMPGCEEMCASVYDLCVNGPVVSECDQALMDCLATVNPEDIGAFEACQQAFEQCLAE